MKKKSYDKSLYQTAEKIKCQVQKELPILEQNLSSLTQTESIMTLPIVIHNICVSLERQAYMFISPALQLYMSTDTTILTPELAAMNKKTIEILEELEKKEEQLYKEQEKQMLLNMQYAEKHGEEFCISAEIDAFNHVEADMSSFFKKVLMLVIAGQMSLNTKQVEIMNYVKEICIYVLEHAISQKKQVLDGVNKILNRK